MMMYGDSSLELEDLTDEFVAECTANNMAGQDTSFRSDLQIAGPSYGNAPHLTASVNEYGFMNDMGGEMYIQDNNYIENGNIQNSIGHGQYVYNNMQVLNSQQREYGHNNVCSTSNYDEYPLVNDQHDMNKIHFLPNDVPVNPPQRYMFKQVMGPQPSHSVMYVQTQPGISTKQVRLIARPNNVQSSIANHIHNNSHNPVLPHNLASTPEAISRMIDHGDYVRPAQQIMPPTILNFGHPTYRFYKNQETIPQNETVNCVSVKASNVANNTTSIINPVKTLTMTIPKKKKPDNVALSATELAQAAALQRIGTEEGWKQMNNWLKQAEKEKKNVHLKELLRQCLQAKVSVDLLMSNDTPKFVRRLSKEHPDSDIKKLSSNCVTKWKQEVANPEIPKKEKKKKAVPVTNTYDDTEDEKSEGKIENPEKLAEKKAEKRRSSDSVEDDKGKLKEKKIKAKAKVYTAKSRLTGFEDAEDPKPPEPKRKRDSMEGVKKPDESKIKKGTPVTKKVTAILSSGFMDALSVSAEPKKKVVAKKKPEKKSTHDPSTTPTVLDGIFAEQQHKPPVENIKVAKVVKSVSPTPVVPVLEAEEPNFTPSARRRIRFADEIGKELVFVKEFEIEEGERINVNHMTPDDMRQHELMMERRYKGNSKIEEEEEQEKPSITWRLILVDDVPTDIVRGSKSEAKLIEEERQRHAMRAFNDPSMPSELAEIDPEDYDPIAAVRHVPRIIPLELQDSQNNQTLQPKATLPDNLQNLLDGLKKKGIVGEGPTNSFASLVPSLGLISNSPHPSAPPTTVSKPPINSMPQGLMRSQGPQQISSYNHSPAQSSYGHNLNSSHNMTNSHPPPHHLPQQPSVSQPRNPHSHIDNSPAMPATPALRMPIIPGGGPGHSHGPPTRQCQFYKTPRGCHFGNRCKFAHGEQQPGVSYGSGRGGYYPRGGGGGSAGGGVGGGSGSGGGYSSRGIRNGPVYSNPPRHHHNDYDHYNRYDHHHMESHSPPQNHIRSPDQIQSPLQSPNAFNSYDSVTRIPSEPLDQMHRIESPTSPT